MIIERNQSNTRLYLNGPLLKYRSLFDLMKDSAVYNRIRTELKLPIVDTSSNAGVLIRTYNVEQYAANTQKCFYFVFDKSMQLVPGFRETYVPVEKDYTIMCVTIDPPYNDDNATIEYIIRLNTWGVDFQDIYGFTDKVYKVRTTSIYYPERGMEKLESYLDKVRDIMTIVQSHANHESRDISMLAQEMDKVFNDPNKARVQHLPLNK